LIRFVLFGREAALRARHIAFDFGIARETRALCDVLADRAIVLPALDEARVFAAAFSVVLRRRAVARIAIERLRRVLKRRQIIEVLSVVVLLRPVAVAVAVVFRLRHLKAHARARAARPGTCVSRSP
jgi:hypothetical protein